MLRSSVGADRTAPVAELAAKLTGCTDLVVDDQAVRFRVPDGAAVLPPLLRGLDAEGVSMTSVEVHRPSLDDVFLTYTGRTIRDSEAPRTAAGKGGSR